MACQTDVAAIPVHNSSAAEHSQTNTLSVDILTDAMKKTLSMLRKLLLLPLQELRSMKR